MQITRISARNRKDPLTDLSTLSSIGRSATKKAQQKAFGNGASITIAKNGIVYRVYPDGKKEQIKKMSTETSSEFPRIEDDLWQD